MDSTLGLRNRGRLLAAAIGVRTAWSPKRKPSIHVADAGRSLRRWKGASGL